MCFSSCSKSNTYILGMNNRLWNDLDVSFDTYESDFQEIYFVPMILYDPYINKTRESSLPSICLRICSSTSTSFTRLVKTQHQSTYPVSSMPLSSHLTVSNKSSYKAVFSLSIQKEFTFFLFIRKAFVSQFELHFLFLKQFFLNLQA